MSDRVVRMKHIGNIEHAVEADRVVLKVNGMAGGKAVRTELSFDAFDVTTVVKQLRDGTAAQVRKWTEAQEAIGK